MNIFGLNKQDLFQTWKMFRMSLRNRYLGSRIGLFWSILNPILTLFIYIIFFGFIMRAEMEGSNNPMDYMRWFICGFSPWMAINEGLIAGCAAIINNVSIVKSFPIKSEIIPIANSMLGLPQMLVGFLVVIILSFVTGAGLTVHALWALFLFPLLFAFLAGISFFLSALTVFVRDIQQIISTVLLFIMFTTPIFFPKTQIPYFLAPFLSISPVHQFIEGFRDVLFLQVAPSYGGIIYISILTLLLWIFGLKLFRRLKGSFDSAL